MNNLNKLILGFLLLSSVTFAEEPYRFSDNQKLRLASTVLISQGISRVLYDVGVGTKGRMVITNCLVIGPAIASELMNNRASGNNLISVGIGVITSNLISFTLDW